MTRIVTEPPPKEPFEDETSAAPVDYDRLATETEPIAYRTIDVNRLPNDLQSKVKLFINFFVILLANSDYDDMWFQYIIMEELGRGAYGTVYRAVERATGKSWAAKVVQVRPGVKKEAVFHEIHMMNQLHHEKLLNLHEAFDLGNEMVLIEEL